MKMSGLRSWVNLALVALIGAGTASMSYADSFVVTYAPAGTQEVVGKDFCKGATQCWVGTENFDSWSGSKPFATSFATQQYSVGGLTGNIIGIYTGAITRSSDYQYGGAGGNGYYATVSDNTYTLTLTATGGVPGVNYFGLWFSALDGGNELQFYEDDTLLYTFTPELFLKLVGACQGGNAFCGNPNNSKDSTEQFAFLNFYDTDSAIPYFNKVVFTQTTGAGFESDNHTVGYMDPIKETGTVVGETPEPGSVVLLLSGLLALIAVRRQFALNN